MPACCRHANDCGGLCQHVVAMLTIVEDYGHKLAAECLPGPESVTSKPRTWKLRAHNVQSQPLMA